VAKTTLRKKSKKTTPEKIINFNFQMSILLHLQQDTFRKCYEGRKAPELQRNESMQRLSALTMSEVYFVSLAYFLTLLLQKAKGSAIKLSLETPKRFWHPIHQKLSKGNRYGVWRPLYPLITSHRAELFTHCISLVLLTTIFIHWLRKSVSYDYLYIEG